MKKIFSILIIVFTLVMVSCQKQEIVLVKIPMENIQLWNEILFKYPFPEEFKVIDTIQDEVADYIIFIDRKDWKNRQDFNPDYGKLLDKQYFCPITDFTSDIFDIAIKDLDNEKMLQLEEIRLPERALSINGLYPDNENYPLIRKTVLKLNIIEAGKNKDQLLGWFNSINEFQEDIQISWLGAVGDIMAQRGVEEILYESEEGIDLIFNDVLPEIQKQDLMIGNLEGAVTTLTGKYPKSVNVKFNTEILSTMEKVGFDYFSIANNHVYDYLEAGFLETLDNFSKSNIGYSGGGITLKDAQAHYEKKVDNNIFRIISLGAFPDERNGFSGINHASVKEGRGGMLWVGEDAYNAMDRSFSRDSVDIVMVHGGKEWTDKPYAKQVEMYRKFIDHGADFVFSSHPHVLQGMELYKGKVIAYSLGNFIFPEMYDMKDAEDSLFLSAGIFNGDVKYLRFLPVKIDNKTISIDKSGEILKRFLDLTVELNKEGSY